MNRNKLAQVLAVLGCAFALKLHYATASADQLRWILAPTAALVEAVSGVAFEFESRAGYLSRERGFLIAASCAGVNFLLTAFLLLTARQVLRAQHLAWRFLPGAALAAYLVTLAANTTRIVVALWLRQLPAGALGLEPAQLHRVEGIVIYFGFLLLLFVVSERLSLANDTGNWRALLLPLLLYYATTLGLPLVNQARLWETEFRAHLLAVVLIPLLLLLPFVTLRCYRQRFGSATTPAPGP